MKLYSLYTHHHKIFKDEWFLPSLKDQFEINISEYSIKDEGEIGNNAFRKAMVLKVSTIINAIKDNFLESIIYSDIDVQFFQNFEDFIRCNILDYDLLIQRDSPFGVFCAGFMVIKCNQNTLSLFERIKELMLERNTHDDQQILNELLFYNIIESNLFVRLKAFSIRRYNKLKSALLKRENKSYKLFTKFKNPFNLKIKHLPATFFGGGTFTADLWKPGDDLIIPDNIILHHANWTIGIENKLEQLKYVKDAVAMLSKDNQ